MWLKRGEKNRVVNYSFEGRTGFRIFLGIFLDFFEMLWNMLGCFPKKCTGFYRVIYPSGKMKRKEARWGSKLYFHRNRNCFNYEK